MDNLVREKPPALEQMFEAYSKEVHRLREIHQNLVPLAKKWFEGEKNLEPAGARNMNEIRKEPTTHAEKFDELLRLFQSINTEIENEIQQLYKIL